ncbi:Ig-like domain-containing protein [Neobacillus mesonae]|uniref:Ig-like domain-containing protein n=1 Tax=Neobacillus mesonae TaxID=1193713 RepID=UPI002E22DFF8|nr:Ig-like domain-containing protein [Neobacillus mesonae]
MLKRALISLVVLFLAFMAFPQAQPASAASSKQQLIIINKKINKLAFYENGKLIKTYSVATGRTPKLTPEGTFYIRNKVKNRPWYKEGIPGGSPRNPLGKRWMELSKQENGGYPYGIHGNNNESSIGKHVSGGCVRMHNWDIEKLFDQVVIGAKVKITTSSQTFNQLAKPFFKNIDVKAPVISKVNTVSDKSTNVTGKTEAKATVTVTIGSKKYSRTADTKGNFNIPVPKQKAGTKISITAKDKAGNVSKAKSVVVLDKTAPALTVKSVSDKVKTVSVKTEAKAYVTITIGKWKSKEIQAKSTGYFNVALPNKQKAGTKITITSRDKAGNKTTKSVTVLDKTAPVVTVDPVSDQSTDITVKTEACASVTVTIGSKNYTAKAVDSKGTYKAEISQQKAETNIKVTVKDKAGNTTIKTVKVVDKTAPDAPEVTSATSTLVTGTAEAGSTITVYANNKAITTGKTNPAGNFTVEFNALEAGTVITVTATDKAGNVSKYSEAKTIEPATEEVTN